MLISFHAYLELRRRSKSKGGISRSSNHHFIFWNNGYFGSDDLWSHPLTLPQDVNVPSIFVLMPTFL